MKSIFLFKFPVLIILSFLFMPTNAGVYEVRYTGKSVFVVTPLPFGEVWNSQWHPWRKALVVTTVMWQESLLKVSQAGGKCLVGIYVIWKYLLIRALCMSDAIKPGPESIILQPSNTEDEMVGWTWVWANSGWRMRKPVLQSMGSQRVRHKIATEQQATCRLPCSSVESWGLTATIPERRAGMVFLPVSHWKSLKGLSRVQLSLFFPELSTRWVWPLPCSALLEARWSPLSWLFLRDWAPYVEEFAWNVCSDLLWQADTYLPA